jgi:tRNA(Phe) wybutosine-synthesizing methylase Tyw3
MRIFFLFLYSSFLYGIHLNAQDTEAAKKLLNQVSKNGKPKTSKIMAEKQWRGRNHRGPAPNTKKRA